MGFWSTLGEIAGEAGKSFKEYSENERKYEGRFQNRSDEDLVDTVRHGGSMAERVAANETLKARYGDDYKSHFH